MGSRGAKFVLWWGCHQVHTGGKNVKVLVQQVVQGMLQYWKARYNACNVLRSPGAAE